MEQINSELNDALYYETRIKKKNFFIMNKTTKKVIDYAKQENISQGKALDHIVETFFAKENSMTKEIADAVYDRFNKDLVRIRLGTNNSDKNSQVLLEMLNSMVINLGHYNFGSTDEVPSDIFNDSKGHVTKRIEHFKLSKQNRENGDLK